MAVPKEAVANALQAYRDQLNLIESTEMGRPQLIPFTLDRLATLADQSIQALGGKPVKLKQPKLDRITKDSHDEYGVARPRPGRLAAGKNPKFVAAHRANLAALEAELAKLPASGKAAGAKG